MPQRDDYPAILAETVRAACVDAALLAYEDAGIRGLCVEGRWEAALAAIRRLDLSGIIRCTPENRSLPIALPRASRT